jgi:geranylgeranyl transferase type-2 subunit beta
MSVEPYLLRLTARLAGALERLPDDVRRRHTAYLIAAQNGDGGFSGREGGSDLYYTGFALRGLAVLDALTPEVCNRAGTFLQHSMTQQASVVDFFSLLYACLLVQAGGGPNVLAESPRDLPERVAATLESLRTADGGYGKTPDGVSGSTYHSFLVGLSYQLLGRSVPRAPDVIRFVLSRWRDDGGFVEIAPMRRSGTNPTAAAVGLLDLMGEEAAGALAEVRDRVTSFLAEMPSLEGGLRANGRAPLADLLSTFTAVWTLDQLGALDRLDCPGCLRYVSSLERAEGGFHGGLWDEGHDVEYTFYGLGALALLTP